MVLTIEEIEGYEEASKAWKARILSMEYLHNLRNEILALEESQCRESHQLVVDDDQVLSLMYVAAKATAHCISIPFVLF